MSRLEAKAPSPWLVRWSHLVRAGGSVLDVAAGSGRHATWLAARGCAVTAVDRDAEVLGGLSRRSPRIRTVVADLEGAAWPFDGQRFDAVVVFNYLWRPLFPALVAAIAPGGALIYETFAAGQETIGRPTRAEHLLQPRELIAAAAGLHVVAYENGFLGSPDRFVQRVVARSRRRVRRGRGRSGTAAAGRADARKRLARIVRFRGSRMKTHRWQHRRAGHADARGRAHRP